ncbi:MAG TPA: TonB-dependent receptor, partial [Chitinophagales bacterium]|nr:TonB-dependent receptor [Chitinophagales bacterium]
MKTKLYLVFLFTLLTTVALAQTFSLKGNVTNDRGNPISGATVVAADKLTVSDALGNYTVNGLVEGTYNVVATHIGFEKVERTVSITSNSRIDFSLRPTSINLGEVKIRAGKSITQTELISGVDKQLRPVNSSQDLLQLVPGLFIAQHAGGGKAEQIFLRGFDNDHGTDFYISIDGMPVNMVSHAHGQGYADFHFVIPETVDKLKVYKGPYTARFGDFSTSGTGEFSTKNSIDQSTVKAEVGMFDTYRGVAMINLLDKRHLFSKQKENAYVAGEYVFSNSYFESQQNFGRFNLFGKYAGALSPKAHLMLSASTFNANWFASGQIPERAVEQGLITRFGSIDDREGGSTSRSNGNAILTTSLPNGALVKNQLYYVKYDFNLFSNFTFFLEDSVNGDGINQKDDRNIFGYSGLYEKEHRLGNVELTSVFGLATRNDITDIALRRSIGREITDTVVSGHVYQQNINGYIDETFRFNRRFSINAGARLDHFYFAYKDNKTDSLSGTRSIARVSPKLNFYYAVNDHVQFFLKSGIGFHSNDARAVVLNHTENSLPKAYGSEIGSEFKLFERMLFNVAVWGLEMESELVYVGDAGVVETSTPTRRVGTDFGMRYQLTKHFFADVDLNYNHGRL